MATRVLATPEAAAAISQIESILNSGLATTIQNGVHSATADDKLRSLTPSATE